jgi:hypothetical protein
MKKLIILICLACVSASVDLRQLVIAIPKTYADANPAKVKRITRYVWSDKVPDTWSNKGWTVMWRNGDSNQVWYLYVVTMHQIKDIATPEWRDQMKAYLDNNPQVRVDISENWLSDAKARGLDYPPTNGVPK